MIVAFLSRFSSERVSIRKAAGKRLVVWMGCLLACVLLHPAYAQQTFRDKVGPGVRQTVAAKSQAFVVVALHEPRSLQAGKTNLTAVRGAIRGVQRAVLAPLDTSHFRVAHRYATVPAFAGVLQSEVGLDRLAQHPSVRRIDLDRGGGGGLASSVSLVRADEWHTRGVTGQQVTVAILDSGLDTDHVDLTNDLVHEACFLDFDGFINGQGRCPNGSDRQTGIGSAEDDHGHGTNVTGIITSDGIRAASGVAPDANIVALKVLDAANSFNSFSEIIAALDHIINTPNLGVQVINMSLGTNRLFQSVCDNTTSWNMAGASAVNTLRERGVIAFAAAMNDGSSTRMASPACLDEVISVGATYAYNEVADFSNSNASLDLLAPGVGITATGMANGTSTFSGTSQATPHAAGCAALLLDAGVGATPSAIEQLLKSSSLQITDPRNGHTFPGLACSTGIHTVELVAFDAELIDEQVRLRWQMERRADSADIHVERSIDGGPFIERGFVEGVETMDGAPSYTFTDPSIPLGADTLVYRLKQVRFDDVPTYSPTVEVAFDPPEQWTLNMASPNPTSGAIELYYTLPEPGHIRLVVYNIRGQRIAELVNRSHVRGRHTIRYNLAGSASGLYFVRLEAGQQTVTRRIVLVR